MRQLFWAVFRGVNGFSKHFSSIATQLKFQVFFLLDTFLYWGM